MSYLISLISPYHNTDIDVFRSSFQSVKKQTIGFENIEYIIVVHNSKEEYAREVKEIAKGFENVKVFILNNEYHTPGSPRNFGLKQATGDYIAFLDSDDTLYPDALKTASDAMREEEAQLCMFRFDNSQDGTNNVVVVRQYSLFDQTKERIILKKGEYDQAKLVTGMCMTVTTKLYDGNFIRSNNLYFDDRISFAEDGLYNTTVFAIAEKIIILPQLIGYQYYQNESSAMQTFKRKQSDLWELCLSIAKIAETGWSRGVYMDAYITEVAASTGAYILCSDVRYPFLKKAGKLIRPYLNIVKKLEETKIDSKTNLRTFNAVNTVVYKLPWVAAFVKTVFRIFHIDLESIIKRSVSI